MFQPNTDVLILKAPQKGATAWIDFPLASFVVLAGSTAVTDDKLANNAAKDLSQESKNWRKKLQGSGKLVPFEEKLLLVDDESSDASIQQIADAFLGYRLDAKTKSKPVSRSVAKEHRENRLERYRQSFWKRFFPEIESSGLPICVGVLNGRYDSGSSPNHNCDGIATEKMPLLALPHSSIKRLELRQVDSILLGHRGFLLRVPVFGHVRLYFENRECIVDAIELPPEFPMIVGRIPLQLLDIVVDLQGRKLIGNPAHGGEQILELY